MKMFDNRRDFRHLQNSYCSLCCIKRAIQKNDSGTVFSKQQTKLQTATNLTANLLQNS